MRLPVFAIVSAACLAACLVTCTQAARPTRTSPSLSPQATILSSPSPSPGPNAGPSQQPNQQGQANTDFTAIWASDPLIVAGAVDGCFGWFGSCFYVDQETVFDNSTRLLPMGQIKVAAQKDLLIGVSAETATYISFDTFTYDRSTMLGEGVLKVSTAVVNSVTRKVVRIAEPGSVRFRVKAQQVEDFAFVGQPQYYIDQSLSWSANHFDFVAPNMPQGTYDIVVAFSLEAFTSGSAVDAWPDSIYQIGVGKRMLTVQEVRACKDCLPTASGALP